MRTSVLRRLVAPMLTALLVACLDSTSAGSDRDTDLVVTGPPDLSVVVFQSTHEEFNAPDGYHHSQYAIWVANPGVTAPDAGVLIAANGPVFVSAAGQLFRVAAAVIAAGDTIQVWRTTSVGYGAVEAPPGAPLYFGRQIVVVR